MSIAAVVVTYNRKELLMTCINSILNQTSAEPDVLVIDNASTDGTDAAIAEIYKDNPRVIYKNTGANIGGAGGFSYGINAAVNMGYDYLWLMDDDTFPSETALSELLKAAELYNNNFGFLASFVKWTDGSPCEMNVPTVSPDWRNDISKQFEHHLIALESASFVSLFIRSEVVKEVGLPIKEFFIWADDMDGEAIHVSDEVTLREWKLSEGQAFKYLFDFGDEWRFNCKVLRAMPELTESPQVIRSKGDAPEQYPDWDEDDEYEDEDEDEDPDGEE